MVKNKSHTLAYSLIALQEMNLAFKYPVMFWNCACLISDSGGADSEEEEIEENIEVEEESYEDSIEEFSNEEEDDELDDEETSTKKEKKKVRTNNYGRIATAIGKIKSSGVEVAPPNINKSTYTFSPDIENNTIQYGLSGISRIGEELIRRIIGARPYESVEDFLNKVKINKPQMINLIKSGAFDVFGNRIEIMNNYIDSISDKKKTINLRNMQMLINFNLIPEEYSFQIKVFNFNKYVKKFKWNNFYLIDEIAFHFYEQHFDLDKLIPSTNVQADFMIKQTDWDKIYKHHQDVIRPYIKENETLIKDKVNSILFKELWDKYAEGTISKWEMDAVSFYSHEHELAEADFFDREVENFGDLPEQPIIDRIIPIKGKQIPLFKITRIAGTILDKDKAKKTVTLLTTDGVVTVKIFGEVFNHYDKQISQKNEITGKKSVIEKSWLSRGNKIIVTGIRREDSFIAKKYKNTPYHLVELISEIDDYGNIITKDERVEV